MEKITVFQLYSHIILYINQSMLMQAVVNTVLTDFAIQSEGSTAIMKCHLLTK